MTEHPVELSNVIYNPASQAFEARAVVHDPESTRSYACAVNAPITMDFQMAAERLTAQARRRHGGAPEVHPLPQARIAKQRHEPTRTGQRAMQRLRQILAAA